MNPTLKIVTAIITIASFTSIIWIVASFWHEYYTEEVIHELKQDEIIKATVKKTTLMIIQQRMQYLERRIYELERDHGGPGVPQGFPSIQRLYKIKTGEYKRLQLIISDLMSKDIEQEQK